ncbi:hypothetical protein BX600DRAFT_439037 [Xylariales sp. PMI_506]|nr:hypothetical protein BX600DRAFT_439037 [Xylariales sp. PMI_506]
MSYYDHIFQFEVIAPVDLAAEVVLLRPLSRRFLTIVVVIVTLHLIVVSVVAALFMWQVQDGFVGSSWAAVSRVSGPATDSWLPATSSLIDAEVRRGLRDTVRGDVSVAVEQYGNQLRPRQR